MALTVTEVYNSCDKERDSNRGLDVAVVTVAMDSSYPSPAGEPLDFTSSSVLSAPMGTVHAVVCDMEDGYLFNYDHTNSTLQCRYFDYNAGADGAAIAVPDGHDLSGISALRLTIFGVRASIS